MDAEGWRQVERLYHAALEHEPNERGIFVLKSCSSNPELLREVESLLSKDELNSTWLEHPAWELLTACDSLQPGEQLGSYKIESVLGRGGMGIVYRATDTA